MSSRTSYGSWPWTGEPYYDYNVQIVDTDDHRSKIVRVFNTGIYIAYVYYTLRYKYLSAEAITHEEVVPQTLRVRATSDASIQKYGRRVFNLTWAEGTEEGAMTAGTSTRLRLGYNAGPSSWHNSHVAIFPNGKRTHIFIMEGKWCY